MYIAALLAALAADDRIKPQEPAEAVYTAWADMNRQKDDPLHIPHHRRLVTRYVHIRQGGDAWREHIWVVNAVTQRTPNLVVPVVLDSGRLVRWDVGALAGGRSEDLQELLKTWEKLAFGDYVFHHVVDVKVDEYTASDGKKYSHKTVAAPAGHAAPVEQNLLNGLTGSGASIIGWENATLVQMVSTADIGGFGQPLYYEFADIPAKEADLLKAFGIDLRLIQDDLRRDRFVAIRKSGVANEKTRRIEVYPCLTGTGFFTRDCFDEDVIKVDFHALLNLLNLKHRATEVIIPGRMGLPLIALYDANGNRQNEVPPNVAHDHQVPNAGSTRLQGFVSCARCHGPNDFLQDAPNYIQELLEVEEPWTVDVLGERYKDALDRVAGLYTGDTETPIQRTRDDFNLQTMKLCGLTLVEACQRLTTRHNAYVYEDVDATIALDEIGELVENDDALATFRALVPMPVPVKDAAFVEEHFFIADLRAGKKLRRHEWKQIYEDVMIQKQTNRLASLKENEKVLAP